MIFRCNLNITYETNKIKINQYVIRLFFVGRFGWLGGGLAGRNARWIGNLSFQLSWSWGYFRPLHCNKNLKLPGQCLKNFLSHLDKKVLFKIWETLIWDIWQVLTGFHKRTSIFQWHSDHKSQRKYNCPRSKTHWKNSFFRQLSLYI